MTKNNVSDDEPLVMWEADWIELQAQERAKRKEEKARQEKERQRKAEHYHVKNKIDFQEDLAEEICERISAGELLLNICDEDHMPTVRRCNQWLKQQSDFQGVK